MYVVIGGGGVMGRGLARELVKGRHDVVVVEQDRAACETVSTRIGALAINGSATGYDTLEEAGIRKADVAVATMPQDADNLAFCLLARNFEVPRIISRMRDTRYEAAYKLAGVAQALNVSELFVGQLVLEIEQPALRHIATFGRGKACIVVDRIPEGAVVDGQTVEQIVQNKAFPKECVVAGIYREEGEEFVFPRGPIEVRAGDQVFLAASTEGVRKASQFLRRTK